VTVGSIAAIDLGASSGRVMLVEVGPHSLQAREIHRFRNDPVALPDGVHWDILRLFHEVAEGLLRSVRVSPDLLSVGVDSWAVDYALLDDRGVLLGNPYHYRDRRTERAVSDVHAIIPPAELYDRTGIQFLPFNTIYQLAAARETPVLQEASTLLLIPDLINYWLGGVVAAEITNASTTGLFDARTSTWATDLIDRLALPTRILPKLHQPGEILGPLRLQVREAVGLGSSPQLTLVGSHDTASAVVAVPADGPDFAYIASGTWSLVGIEIGKPVLTGESRVANFTNEIGVDGRVRFLRNVTGLWLLQECLRIWERSDETITLDSLLDAAAQMPVGGPTIDPDDPALMGGDDMPARIVEACRRTDQQPPGSPPALTRCILDSLAVAYARTIADAERLAGRRVGIVHIVGGGSRNSLLCQLTADACERPVTAGPVEATAIGNALVQARSHGLVSGGLEDLRSLVRATQDLRSYMPNRARL